MALFLSVLMVIPYPAAGHSQALLSPLDTLALPQQASLDPVKIHLSEALGEIQEVYKGTRPETVIIIQDAHAIPEAQRSIRELIEYFQKAHKIGLVASEGASGAMDPRIFRSFPFPEDLRAVLDDYFKDAELTGVASAALLSPYPSVYEGVEDWPLFEQGIRYFWEALQNMPKVEAALKTLRAELEREKEKVYPTDLLTLDRKLEKFYANQLNLIDAIKVLSAHENPAPGSGLALLLEEMGSGDAAAGGSFEVELKSVASKISSRFAYAKGRMIEVQRQQLLREFNSKNQDFRTSQLAPAEFAAFLKETAVVLGVNLRFSDSLENVAHRSRKLKDIEGTKIFEELEAFSQHVKASLMKDGHTAWLDTKGHELRLLDRLSHLELSREQWLEVDKLDSEAWPVLEIMEPQVNFYQNALVRDQIFYDNYMTLSQNVSEEGTARQPHAGVLVAGGFHSEGLAKIFRNQGVSYVLVRPAIEGLPEENRYREHMQGEVSWKDYYQVEEGGVSIYRAFVRAARDRLLRRTALNPEEETRVLKAWRDQLLQDLAEDGRIQEASDYNALLTRGGETVAVEAPETFLKGERFISELKQLETSGALNRDAVRELLARVTSADFTYQILSPNDRSSLLRDGRVRTELRADETPPAGDLMERTRRYQRDHNLIPLHTVEATTLDDFSKTAGIQFSQLKYGDPDAIKEFGRQIAERIWTQFKDEILKAPENWIVIAPATKTNPTAAVLLTQQVVGHLREKYGVNLPQISLKRKKTMAGDFGKLQTQEAREQQIFGKFYYDGPSLEGKHAFFIEDALLSGTHYRETQRVLEEDGKIDLADVHGLFIVNALGETFGKEQYSIESVLNQIWVSEKNPRPIVEILNKSAVEMTPRLLKFLLTIKPEELLPILELTEFRTVLSVYYGMLIEGLNNETDFKENFNLLKDSIEKRLAGVKRQFGVTSVVTVNDGNLEKYFNDPVYDHPLFGRVSLGALYSLLKHGDNNALEYFAEAIAGQIRSKVGTDNLRASRWSVVTAGYAATPGAAAELTRRVSNKLGLSQIPSGRRETPLVSYSGIADARVRQRLVQGSFDLIGPTTENVIYIDDAVTSGAHVEEFTALAKRHGAREVLPVSILDIATVDINTEERINQSFINEQNIETFTALLQNAETRILVRTLKTLLSFSDSSLESVLTGLSVERVREIRDAARADALNRDGIYARGFQTIERHLAARPELRTQEVPGRVPGLPAFTALETIRDDNAAQMIRDFGATYSGLKYGDRAAIEQLSRRLADQILADHGDQIRENPEGWVIAATGYFRVPNAARFLGERVSELLGLKLADMRTRKIFEGAFGGLASTDARLSVVDGSVYVSDPHDVKGKNVLYIDDALTSGAHLFEHHRQLVTAGAATVASYFTTDIGTTDQTVEEQLNLARVNPENLDALIAILQDPLSPVLTRTLKLLLNPNKVSTAEFRRVLAALDNDRVFDLFEDSEVESYGTKELFAEHFAILEQEALSRHLADKAPLEEAVTRDFRLMIFDYDETLQKTLTPLDDKSEGIDALPKLVFRLERGVHIGIVSQQPIGDRGLRDTVLNPLREYLIREGKSLDLLKQVHLLPESGARVFEINREGQINEEAPLSNVAFQPDEWTDLVNSSRESVEGLATREFLRGSYISYHFANEADQLQAKAALEAVLSSFRRPVEIKLKDASNGTKVLHITLKGLDKAVGRAYLFHRVKCFLEAQTGERIPRAQILVAGDNLGTGQPDAAMFVFGGVNLAMGSEARPGAYTEYANRQFHGTYDFLDHNQAILQPEERPAEGPRGELRLAEVVDLFVPNTGTTSPNIDTAAAVVVDVAREDGLPQFSANFLAALKQRAELRRTEAAAGLDLGTAFEQVQTEFVDLMVSAVRARANERRIQLALQAPVQNPAASRSVSETLGQLDFVVGSLLLLGHGSDMDQVRRSLIEQSQEIEVTTVRNLERVNLDPVVQRTLPYLTTSATPYEGRNEAILTLGMEAEGLTSLPQEVQFYALKLGYLAQAGIAVAAGLSGETREMIINRLRTGNYDGLSQEAAQLLNGVLLRQFVQSAGAEKAVRIDDNNNVWIQSVAMAAYLQFRAEQRVKEAA